MQCRVTVAGMASFEFRPGEQEGTAGCAARACRPDQCRVGTRGTGPCLLLAGVASVLDYFSGVVSHAMVRVAWSEGDRWETLEEPGQRAALRLLLLGMTGSGCPYFGRFAVRLGADPTAAALALFGGMTQTMAEDRLFRAAGRPSRVGEDVAARLHPLLVEARRLRRHDAALNGVVMLLNCNELAAGEPSERPKTVAVSRPAVCLSLAGRRFAWAIGA